MSQYIPTNLPADLRTRFKNAAEIVRKTLRSANSAANCSCPTFEKGFYLSPQFNRDWTLSKNRYIAFFDSYALRKESKKDYKLCDQAFEVIRQNLGPYRVDALIEGSAYWSKFDEDEKLEKVKELIERVEQAQARQAYPIVALHNGDASDAEAARKVLPYFAQLSKIGAIQLSENFKKYGFLDFSFMLPAVENVALQQNIGTLISDSCADELGAIGSCFLVNGKSGIALIFASCEAKARSAVV